LTIVVRYPSRWVVLKVLKPPGIVCVENGIVDQIPRMKVQPDDRPYLGSNRFGLPIVVVDAKLEIGCINKGVIVSVGSRE
jgi:hypothetical protein